MMIDVFISPASTWHAPVAPPKPPQPPRELDRIDLLLFKTLEKHGRFGCFIWPLLNEAAAQQQPRDRAEARQLRLELWQRLRRLMKTGVVIRFTRKSISVHSLPRHTVNRRRRQSAGSTHSPALSGAACQSDSQVGKSASINNLRELASVSERSKTAAMTESALTPWIDAYVPATPSAAMPAPNAEGTEKIRQAARELARLPRKVKRRWSGYVNGVRIWHNQRIILPNGELAFAYGAIRGRVIWSSRETYSKADLSDDKWSWGVADASKVKLVKNPHAVALGKRKAGVREKESDAKKRAARANGLKARGQASVGSCNPQNDGGKSGFQKVSLGAQSRG